MLNDPLVFPARDAAADDGSTSATANFTFYRKKNTADYSEYYQAGVYDATNGWTLHRTFRLGHYVAGQDKHRRTVTSICRYVYDDGRPDDTVVSSTTLTLPTNILAIQARNVVHPVSMFFEYLRGNPTDDVMLGRWLLGER
jgi:hypothetical protein